MVASLVFVRGGMPVLRGPASPKSNSSYDLLGIGIPSPGVMGSLTLSSEAGPSSTRSSSDASFSLPVGLEGEPCSRSADDREECLVVCIP